MHWHFIRVGALALAHRFALHCTSMGGVKEEKSLLVALQIYFSNVILINSVH